MSGEQDAKARLEAAIAKHVYGGNVIPFPSAKRKRQRAQAPRISIGGHGNAAAAIIGSHNHVTINVRTGNTEEDARWRQIRYIKTNQVKLGRSDREVSQFLRENFGKGCLVLCTLDELITVRQQLVAIWRHHF